MVTELLIDIGAFIALVDRREAKHSDCVAFLAGDAWVIDGNYRKVRDLVWGRATTVVWVDPSRSVVMAQVLWRSFLRAVTRRELWHGNREDVRKWIDPEHLIRWAWRTYNAQRTEHESLVAPHWVRLRSRGDVRRWLKTVRTPPLA